MHTHMCALANHVAFISRLVYVVAQIAAGELS
jgi:hypothetical protein